jgi:hypothetical protein
VCYCLRVDGTEVANCNKMLACKLTLNKPRRIVYAFYKISCMDKKLHVEVQFRRCLGNMAL